MTHWTHVHGPTFSFDWCLTDDQRTGDQYGPCDSRRLY